MELVVSISTDYYSGGNCVVILVGNNYICDCFQLDFFMQLITFIGMSHQTRYNVSLIKLPVMDNDDYMLSFVLFLYALCREYNCFFIGESYELLETSKERIQ